MVVGGTGLYVRALAEGLFREPALDPARRRALEAWTARLEPLELVRWAGGSIRDSRAADASAPSRAIEVALLTGRPLSHWQARGAGREAPSTRGTLC